MTILLLILGLILFVGLVVVHEWGHFIMARRNGVDVEEFGIGFPPKIKGWTIKGKKTAKNKNLPASAHKDFEFTLNWLPLGGFVKLKGEHDSDTAKGTFGATTTWNKTKIMAAGVIMNLLTAFFLFTIVAWLGMPSLIENQYSVQSDARVVKQAEGKGTVKLAGITKNSPAEKAGLKDGDRIITVADRTIDTNAALPKATAANAGRTVKVVTERDGQRKNTEVKLNGSSPYLGAGAVSGKKGYDINRYTWSAPIVAVGTIYDFTIATFKGLGTALAGLGSMIAGIATGNAEARSNGQAAASSQVGGPLAILAVLGVGSTEGIAFLLFIVAIISLSLAIMNVLPIPALDGGKLFITYLWRSFGRRVPEKVEDYIYGGSFLLLLALVVLITISDAGKIDFTQIL